jgi:hypothetical protein
MMESWNEIVHIAMLGTDKRLLNEASLPELKENAAAVSERYTNKEEQFLGLASLVLNYRQSGVMPVRNKEVHLTKASTEEHAYANALAHQVLNEIIAEDSISLLSVWLQWCSYKNRIVQPEVIPLLMEIAIKNKSLQQLVLRCTGKRGEWLASYNEQWKFASTQTDEELWQTGTLEQRRQVLQNTRKKDAAKGRELLQTVWSQENAVTKSELLKQLSVGISNEDVSWLETLSGEKSEKVKEAAAELLQQIPTSFIVQQYWNVLQQSVKVKEGRKILGIGSKNSLIMELPGLIDPAIFRWGIEKLSNRKNFSDNEYIIYQLIQRVPPHFWQEWLQTDVKAIVLMFRSEKNIKYLSALGSAAALFNNIDWLRAIIQVDEKTFYPSVFSILPQIEKEVYAISFLASDETAPEVIEELIANSSAEWSIALTKSVFQFTSKRPYQYHHSFYNQNIKFIPYGINPELERCAPSEEYSKIIWNKTIEYIHKLLMLKYQTAKAFEGGDEM